MLFMLLLAGNITFAKSPIWFSSGERQEGKYFFTTCTNTSPSLDLARRLALESCKASAVNKLNVAAKFESRIVETETDVALYEQTSKQVEYANLDCQPVKEEVVEDENSFTIYKQCRFDLSKATLTNEMPPNDENITANHNQLEIFNYRKDIPAKKGRIISSETESILIFTIPSCDDILVKGKVPRIIRCNHNPMSVLIYPEDQELAVRSKGHLPEKIDLTKGVLNHEVQIIFQKY